MNRGDSEFDWAPQKLDTHPSNYILELSSYLMATFPAFSALAAETREALYYITCKSIASRYHFASFAPPWLPYSHAFMSPLLPRLRVFPPCPDVASQTKSGADPSVCVCAREYHMPTGMLMYEWARCSFVCIYLCIHMLICMCIFMYLYTYVSMHVVCVCVCVCV